MTDLDREIRKALAESGAPYGETDLPIDRQLIAMLHGRMAWLNILGTVAGLVLLVLAVACARAFLDATTTRDMIIWSGATAAAVAALAMIKLWFWMVLHKNAILREVKRLELQVAHLSSRLQQR